MHYFYSHFRWHQRTMLVAALAIVILAGSVSAKKTEGEVRIPDEGTTQVIKLEDGSTVVGRITEIGEEQIKFKTDIGELSIAISKIVEIKEITESIEQWKKGWYPNPNRTRLFFSPTGRTLRAGEGYFSDIMIFFPSVSVGITDNITLGGGLSIFPGIDFDKQIYFLTPKVGFSINDYFSAAISTIFITIPKVLWDDDSEVEFVGILFGTSTVGTEDKSLTFGLGFGYANEGIADKPVVIVGGELRVARRMSLVTENWVFPEVDDPTVSYGMRFFGEELAVDLAFFNSIDDNAIFPGFPFLNFVVNF